MRHLASKQLETPRLILRKFILEDAENMYKNWASDEEVVKYLTWPAHSSVEVTKQVLNDWISSYSKKDFYQWAIVLKSLNEPIGSITVVDQADSICMVHIGYCMGKDWWGRGYTTEALEALVKFFFEEVGVNRIESRHDVNNPNSGKVMTKCGFKYEGRSRQSEKSNQGLCDTDHYAILASDYF